MFHQSEFVTHKSCPKVFKLNVDCFECIFDYLSLGDLHSLGQTCQRMRQIVGFHIRENYPALTLSSKSNGLYLNCCVSGCKMHQLHQYIQKITIRHLHTDTSSITDRLAYLSSHCLQSLKKIQISNVHLTAKDICFIEPLLNPVETIVLENCTIDATFYYKFPQISSKTKRLHIENIEFDETLTNIQENQWFLITWQNLEYFGWSRYQNSAKIPELTQFFKLNPKIRTFWTNIDCLWANRDALAECKFGELSVDVFDWELTNGPAGYEFLNDIHGKGVYKRLRVQALFYDSGGDNIAKLASLNALECLPYLNLTNENILPNMEHLKELRIDFLSPLSIDMRNLVNLERLHLQYAAVGDFMPFLCQLKKLRVVKIDAVLNFEDDFDLERIEMARRGFGGSKVTIYCDEKLYLAMKWRGNVDRYRFVDVKRTYSHDFDYFVE